MKRTTRLAKRAVLFGVLSLAMGSAAAQGLPKEGRIDVSSCFSGEMQFIAFPKTNLAYSYEFMGTTRTNPAGGVFDQTSFRCVGGGAVIEGKAPGGPTESLWCEIVDRDGDKAFWQYDGYNPNFTGTALVGTGKYEGMVATTKIVNLPPFPTVKPGAFQNCNHQTGSYKIK